MHFVIIILVKDSVFLLVRITCHLAFFMSLEACENDMNSVFCVKIFFLHSGAFLTPDTRPQQEPRTTGRNRLWLTFVTKKNNNKKKSADSISIPYRLLTTCRLRACGDLDLIIWFLILAAFNSFLQMATTVGKIELLLPGHSNKHVCLISHCREKDDDVQIVMNLDFMKSPSLLERHHLKWFYFTLT